MADTIRELILQDIEALLADRHGADNVYRGRIQFPEDVIPCVGIVPGVERAEKFVGQEQRCIMPVAIYCLQVVGDNDVGPLAEVILGQMISDVIGGRASIDRVDDVVYLGGGVEDWPELDEQTLKVKMEIEVQYNTNLGDPYNQTTL